MEWVKDRGFDWLEGTLKHLGRSTPSVKRMTERLEDDCKLFGFFCPLNAPMNGTDQQKNSSAPDIGVQKDVTGDSYSHILPRNVSMPVSEKRRRGRLRKQENPPTIHPESGGVDLEKKSRSSRRATNKTNPPTFALANLPALTPVLSTQKKPRENNVSCYIEIFGFMA